MLAALIGVVPALAPREIEPNNRPLAISFLVLVQELRMLPDRRQALERFPDQEVAAHLGEVLWANGKQREAKKIWGTFLKENPDSPILRKTILRLTGSENL